MTYKMPAWSYSSLTAFETCPKRYFHTKIAKDIADPPSAVAQWGTEVHKHLEDRLVKGTPLPESVAKYEPIVAPLERGHVVAEQQLAVNSKLQPTGWFDKDVWCRGIVDATSINANRTAAVLVDWKTGKRKPESEQLKLFAGLAFAHHPELETVRTAFVWLKEDKVDQETYVRKDIPVIWRTFIPRVQRMERAFDAQTFLPKPSGLCAKWCPVPKSVCEFSGKI